MTKSDPELFRKKSVEIHLSPERQEQLNEYAQRHGQSPM